MNLSEQQLHTLRHMLGINTPTHRTPRPHRNYATVVPGDQEYVELEELGMVERYLKAGERETEYDWYQCTEAGKLEAMRSHKAIRLPKSKRMYSRYLEISDTDHELTFKEFLTHEYFAEARADV